MVLSWRVCVVVAVVTVVGVSGSGDERWVWRRSARGGNRKASSIPGYVPPTPPTTTAPPPITTFRPATSIRGLGRGAPGPRYFPRASANPFFLGPFPHFSLVPINPSRHADDGTTKSRAPVDTAFDGAGGAVLDAGDKYTTLDRLQQERGAPPPLPRPKAHQLGGLHPDEVYYADDDLLIIKGGGFHSDAFQEPSQTLDEEEDLREGSPTNLSPVVAPLPSPHHEYNGNIPAIVPPPHQMTEQPLSLFVDAASDKDYILVPHVIPSAKVLPAPGTVTNRVDDSSKEVAASQRVTTGYVYAPPTHPVSFLTRPAPTRYVLAPYRQAQVLAKPFQAQAQARPFQAQAQGRPFQAQVQARPFQAQVQARPFQAQVQARPFQAQFQARPFHNSLTLPHSLAGDTDVNFREPLPSINPDAEVFQPWREHERFIPGRTRQLGKPRV